MNSKWQAVGDWLKGNAGTGAALVGSLLTGNVPAAVAAGVALVSSATGQSEPDKVLQSFQSDPATVIKLRELALADDQSIRQHIQKMAELELTDTQAEHHEQQETIRTGDVAQDKYNRRTRPKMARQSWWAGTCYVIGFEAAHALNFFSFGASLELAGLLFGPALAYLGFRTWDKHQETKFAAMGAK